MKQNEAGGTGGPRAPDTATTPHHPVTRRDFLRYTGIGSAAMLLGFPASGLAAPQTSTTASTQSGSGPDLWLELTAAPHRIALRPGPATPVWAYRARVLKGDAASVRPMPGPDTYLGPILHVHRGQKLRIDFVNHIDKPGIVNWHGLHVPADMMGLPREAVKPGKRYRYEFEVRNRAGTYWYHAMSTGYNTPEQVYYGLAGLLLVSDNEEQALSLPRGEYDLPIVIQDRDWGSGNQFHYPLSAGPNAPRASHRPGGTTNAGGMMGGRGMMSGGMREAMLGVMGFYGHDILVNGRPDTTLKVTTHAYRLRVLNASNSRTYKLAWQDHRPLTVIATGGGLLEKPLHKNYVMLTPGQRIELWADFSQDAVGTQHTLMSLAFKGSMNMMGMMGGGESGRLKRAASHAPLPDGARFPIAKVVVTRKTDHTLELPRQLSTITRLRAEDAVNHGNPRTFRVTIAA